MFETRRLPGSGAGPSPDRMIIGSEGALGIITKAWMRLQQKPFYKASCAVQFKNFEDRGNYFKNLVAKKFKKVAHV